MAIDATQTNRRREEASALRVFFGEQLQQLQTLLQARHESARSRVETDRVVEDLVERTNPRLRIIGGYKRRLRTAVGLVLEHVIGEVHTLPAALRIAPRRYTTDQRLNTYFSGVDAIKTVCGGNEHLLSFFQDPQGRQCEDAFFSLFMTRREKSVFGMALIDGRLVGDQPQQLLYFDDHGVHGVSDTEAGARICLNRVLFDRIVDYLRHRMLSKSAAHARGADGRMLDRRLSPQAYFEDLTRALAEPKSLLKMESGVLRVSKLGVKMGPGNDGQANEISSHEVAVGETAPQTVILAAYPRAELSACSDPS